MSSTQKRLAGEGGVTLSERCVKRSMLLAALLVLTLVLPVAADELREVSRSYEWGIEIPVGNWALVQFGANMWADFGFDNATIVSFDIELNTSQLVNMSLSVYDDDFRSFSLIRSMQVNGSVHLNKSDLLLDDWVGIPSRSNWTSYNTTHIVKGTHYSMYGPWFVVIVENVVDEIVVVEYKWNYTYLCHGVKEAESYVFPTGTDWTNTTTVTYPEGGVWQFWDYWGPELSNPVIDAFFKLWLSQQNRTDVDDRWIFSYDPTRYITIAFEYGLTFGIVIGLFIAIVVGWFGQKLLGVEG